MAPPNPDVVTSQDDEEDDYMNMTFTDTPAMPETSLQRRKRQQREAEQRAKVASKAELAEQEEARREAALSRSLFDRPTPGSFGSGAAPAAFPSKGAAMMAKMGFTGGALGAAGNEAARAEPLRISVRDGREGIGVEGERKKRLREAAAAAEAQSKKARLDEGAYRDRVRREREEARLERQVYAAQKVAERMDEEGGTVDGRPDRDQGEEEDDKTEANGSKKSKKPLASSSRPLKSLPIVYRGLVRRREEAERDRRMRHDLEQSLSRLPTYDDPDENADDRRALGRTEAVYAAAEDLDEEDPELDDFDALDVDEKLRQLVEYLRRTHRYCFWCKFTYPDEAMEGCPGLTEEDHD